MCCNLISTELIAVDKENITRRNWFIDLLGKKKKNEKQKHKDFPEESVRVNVLKAV